MNGTSMASPCACGGLALLASALKAEGQALTPARLRRAVENSCLPVGERMPNGVLTYGRGLLQVSACVVMAVGVGWCVGLDQTTLP